MGIEEVSGWVNWSAGVDDATHPSIPVVGRQQQWWYKNLQGHTSPALQVAGRGGTKGLERVGNGMGNWTMELWVRVLPKGTSQLPIGLPSHSASISAAAWESRGINRAGDGAASVDPVC